MQVFFGEDGEVQVDIMMECVEMSLPIVSVFARVEVACPDIHVINESLRVYLLKQE